MRAPCNWITPGLAVALLAGCAPPEAESRPVWSSDVVELPATAAEPMRLTDPRSGVWITARLSGAADVGARVVGDDVVYAGASEMGGDLVFRPRQGGTEDWVGYPRAPERAAATYELILGARAGGLRLVERVLEVLDASGTPRLRVSPPFVVGADGRRHEAALDVEGCALDRSLAAPWGRRVVPPGQGSCRLVVAWDAALVAYPAVLDPMWTTTQDLGDSRARHGACRLANGRVLVAAGTSSIGAELFDPSTETWSVTGAPPAPDRTWSMLVCLDDGRALIAGGATGFVLASAALYDPATGMWTATPDMAVARTTAAATRLAGGTVLVTGGDSGFGLPVASAERFDPVLGTWSSAGAMSAARVWHTVSLLADGRALAAGSYTGSTQGLSSADLYDPVANAWTPAAPMSVARGYHTASLLADGRLLVAGGYDGIDLADVELFDPTPGIWTPGPPLPAQRSGHTAASFPSGRALLAGGCINTMFDCPVVPDAFGFDPGAMAWVATPPMSEGRLYHTETTLADGRILVVGGQGTLPIASAELFELAPSAAPCAIDGECASSHCADGVCCDAACTAPCVACVASKTGLAEGTCGPVPAREDPDADCVDSGSPACAETGVCDGAGACELYARPSGCDPAPCSAAADCASGFCDPDDSICCDAACTGQCEACTAEKKGGGEDGVCGSIEGKTDPDAECSADPSEDDCAQITLCNGAGACEAATSLCVPFACSDGACLDGCTEDSACAPGFRCNRGACLESDSSCKDEQTAVDGSGAEYPCAPYVCKAGDCLTACTSVDDCIPPAVCDSAGACVPPPPEPGGDEGCSCRHASSGANPHGAAALLALCAATLRARRRLRAPRLPRSRGSR